MTPDAFDPGQQEPISDPSAAREGVDNRARQTADVDSSHSPRNAVSSAANRSRNAD